MKHIEAGTTKSQTFQETVQVYIRILGRAKVEERYKQARDLLREEHGNV